MLTSNRFSQVGIGLTVNEIAAYYLVTRVLAL